MTAEHEHAQLQVAATCQTSDEALTWAVRQLDRLALGRSVPVNLTIQSFPRPAIIPSVDGGAEMGTETMWQVNLIGPYPSALPASEPALPTGMG